MTSFAGPSYFVRGIGAVPPVEDWEAERYGLSHARVTQLHRAGFNTLRLWPSIRDIAVSDSSLTWNIRKWLDYTHAAAERGFKVILCFGGAWSEQFAILGGTGTQNFQVGLKTFARALTDEFMPEMVAIELLNEPPGEDELAARGLPSYVSVTAPTFAWSVHTTAPNLTVITQASGGWSENLAHFDPRNFSNNTLFSFHFYNSGLFTHQGAVYRYVDRIPFPANASSHRIEPLLAKALSRIAEDHTLAPENRIAEETWYRLNIPAVFWDKSPDSREWFAWPKLTAWLDKSHLPSNRILCTEFGVTGDFNFNGTLGADEGSRARWYKSARQAFERSGFCGWVAHQAMGDFNLFEQKSIDVHGDALLPWVQNSLFE